MSAISGSVAFGVTRAISILEDTLNPADALVFNMQVCFLRRLLSPLTRFILGPLLMSPFLFPTAQRISFGHLNSNARSYGFFWGHIGVQRHAQLDGSMVFGGYDRAKVRGPPTGFTSRITNDQLVLPEIHINKRECLFAL